MKDIKKGCYRGIGFLSANALYPNALEKTIEGYLVKREGVGRTGTEVGFTWHERGAGQDCFSARGPDYFCGSQSPGQKAEAASVVCERTIGGPGRGFQGC